MSGFIRPSVEGLFAPSLLRFTFAMPQDVRLSYVASCMASRLSLMYESRFGPMLIGVFLNMILYGVGFIFFVRILTRLLLWRYCWYRYLLLLPFCPQCLCACFSRHIRTIGRTKSWFSSYSIHDLTNITIEILFGSSIWFVGWCYTFGTYW